MSRTDYANVKYLENLVKPLKKAISTTRTYLDTHRVVPTLPRRQKPKLLLPNLPSVTVPKIQFHRVPDLWIKYAVTVGWLVTAMGALSLLGKLLMAQEDPESTVFSACLMIGLIVLGSGLFKPSD